MKSGHSVMSQIIFQSIRTMVSIVLVGGIALLFIQDGTGVLTQSLDNLENAKNLLTNFAS